MRRKNWIIAVLAIAAPLMALAGASAKSRGADDAVRKKARHYYLSAAQHDAEGRNAEAAELYKRAYELDTTYAEAALQYGVRRWGMPGDTLATPVEKERSRRIARKFVEKYPGDLFPVMMFANIMDRGNELDEKLYALEGLKRYLPHNTDLMQMLADTYLDLHDFDKALATIEEYEKAEGESLELTIRKAGMRLAMQDSAGAIGEVDRIMAKNPKEPQYLILKSQLQSYIHQPDSAMATAKAAEKMYEPGYGGPVKVHMAEMYKELGDSVNYDNKIYEALLSEDLSFEMKNELLAYYLQQLINDNGERQRGDKLFTVLLGQYPHEPSLRALAARYSASKGNFGQALEEVEYAIDLDPRNKDYWASAIMFSLMLDNHEQTRQILQRAKKSLRTVPLQMYVFAGGDAASGQDYAGALELYKEAMAEHMPGMEIDQPIDRKLLAKYLTVDNLQDVVSLYQQAGDAYYQLDDRRRAFVDYENSLSLDPDSPLTLNNYAYFLIEKKEHADAGSIAKADEMSLRAITLAPNNSTYLDTRAWVLFRKGDYKEAKEIQMRAIEAAGEDVSDEDATDLYSHLGDILFMAGQPEEALEAWKKALKGDPANELLKKKVQHKTFHYE